LLCRPVADADAAVARRQLIGELARSIGRAIVHDEEVRARQGALDRLGDRADAGGLVVGRQDDPDTLTRRGCLARLVRCLRAWRGLLPGHRRKSTGGVDAPSGDRAAQLTDTDIEPRFVLPSES